MTKTENCKYHPNRVAVGNCFYCKDSICNECNGRYKSGLTHKTYLERLICPYCNYKRMKRLAHPARYIIVFIIFGLFFVPLMIWGEGEGSRIAVIIILSIVWAIIAGVDYFFWHMYKHKWLRIAIEKKLAVEQHLGMHPERPSDLDRDTKLTKYFEPGHHGQHEIKDFTAGVDEYRPEEYDVIDYHIYLTRAPFLLITPISILLNILIYRNSSTTTFIIILIFSLFFNIIPVWIAHYLFIQIPRQKKATRMNRAIMEQEKNTNTLPTRPTVVTNTNFAQQAVTSHSKKKTKKKTFQCLQCGHMMEKGMKHCPNCGDSTEEEHFIN